MTSTVRLHNFYKAAISHPATNMTTPSNRLGLHNVMAPLRELVAAAVVAAAVAVDS
jgi:hypothetical protein